MGQGFWAYPHFDIGHIYHSLFILPHDNVVVGFRVSLAARTIRVPALDIVLRDRTHPDRVLHPSLLVSGSDCEATEDQRIPVRDARPLPPLLILAPHWLEAVLSQPMRTRAWRGRGGRGPGPGTGLRRSDSRGRYGEIWIPSSRPGHRRFCGENIWVSQRTVAISEYSENKFSLLWGEAQLCLPYVCL